MNRETGFIGAGNMGGTIIRGLLAHSVREASEIMVSDPNPLVTDGLQKDFPSIRIMQELDYLATRIVVVALKPQVYKPVLKSLRGKINADCIVVTIAPGITMEAVSSWLGGHKKIIRTMPNTPALIGEGLTALCASDGIAREEFNLVQEMFDSIGSTVTLTENMLNAYTSVAASSPAWVFMFLEALADAAVREGMSRPMAYKIAARTLAGSARLMEETGEHPAVLKDRVCSPAGTTIEAVSTLESKGFRSAIMEAVRVSTARAAEMELTWKK